MINMPGPGHNHSERFEACLSHLKSQGADDGKAHRVCYTSVGKSMYGLENSKECGCSEGMERPGHREHGPVGRDFITLEDLSLGCMYCKELIEMEEFYKTKYAGDEEPSTRPYRGVSGTRQSADGVYTYPAEREKLFVDRANERKMSKGPLGFGSGEMQSPEAQAVTIGRKAYNLSDDPNAFQPHTDPQKDAGSVSSATPNAVNPVYRQKSLEDRVADLEECSKQMKPLMQQMQKSEHYDFELKVPILPVFIDLAKADGQRKIAGWASVEIVDRHGELITMESFDEKTIANFMSRTGGRIHLQHQDVPIGVVTNIERRKMPDGTPGLWVEAELINLGESIDDAVWNGVLRGKISGFSIKGRAMERETRCNADLCYAYIPEIELYGISAVEKPANQASAISAVVDDKGHNVKLSDESNNTILTGINMSKSLSKAEKPPFKPKEQAAEVKGGDGKDKVPGVPPRGAGAKPAEQHGEVPEAKEPGESPQDGSDEASQDQEVEKPETPDTGMGMEERFRKAESAIAGLTEAMRKLAPGTQEAARTAAAMAEGLSRKSDEEEDESMKKDEGEAGEVEAEEEEEEEKEGEAEGEVEAEAGPFDVPHKEPEGGIPGHQPPDFGMKKEIPAGGQYVEHPDSPKGTIAEQLASVQKELADLKKQLSAKNKLPVSNSRAAPIIQKTNTTTKIGRTEVPSDVAKEISDRLKGVTNDHEFMKKAFKMRYE